MEKMQARDALYQYQPGTQRSERRGERRVVCGSSGDRHRAATLALCYVLINESLYDSALSPAIRGFAPYRAYLMGERDGIAKTPEWAAAITGLRRSGLSRWRARWRACARWSISRGRFSGRARANRPTGRRWRLPRCWGKSVRRAAGVRIWLRLYQSGRSGAESLSGPRLPAGDNAVNSVIPVARLSDICCIG